MNRVASKVKRPSLGAVYRANMVRYLEMLGADPKDAVEFIDKTIKNRFIDRTIVSVDREHGHLRLNKTKLSTFTSKMSDSIVTPSGSFYDPHYVKLSLMSEFAEDGLAMRKVLKSKQFECKAAGDEIGSLQAMFAQTQVKINLNSLPGGFGSPYNIFYDKGGYNSITSVARALIAHAYTTCELGLGGNPAIFDIEELMNWIVIATGKMPSNDQIAEVTNKYFIRWATKKDLVAYFHKTLSNYDPALPVERLEEIVNRMNKHQVQYMYYLGNLPHLLFNNDKVMRPVVQDILSHAPVESTGIDPAEFYKLDSDILAVAMTIRSKELTGINIKKIVDNEPELAKMMVATVNRIQEKLSQLDELLNTFIYSNISTQKILSRKNMKRNSVVVSDTDSIIFTSKNWLQWYAGTLEGLSQDSYDIAALATYLITKVNEDSMAKFAIDCGATGKYVRQMKMKNEFLYPILIIYDIKKTYCGMVKVQEGVMLPEGELDLKGGALRSSNIPPKSLQFTEDFIVEEILKPAEHGRLKASKLISEVLKYENGIRGSLNNLETTFVERKSINTEESYANPDSSAWLYAVAWNRIFSEKYGIFHPPDKVAILKLLKPTQEYYEYVKGVDSEICSNILKFVKDKGKFPPSIVIPNSASGIPKELSPIINVREIVYMNMKPTYITLDRLGIHVGHSSENLLLSDVYTV